MKILSSTKNHMKILSSTTNTTWLVEYDGLKYVRTYYHLSMSVVWSRNFDYHSDIADKIVSEVDLEEIFAKNEEVI